MPSASGLSKKDQRKARREQQDWLTKQEDYNSFKANELKAEVERLKNIYDPTRAALKRDQDAAFVAPELQKYKKFVRDAGFHDDAAWALRTADGHVDSAKILFDACKDQAELKKFGVWAVANGFGGPKLFAVLKAAADFASRREQGAGCGALPGGLPGSGNPAVARDARTDDER